MDPRKQTKEGSAMNWRTMIVPAAMAGVLGLAACEETGTTDLAPPFAEAVAFHPDAVDYRPVTVKGAGADPKQQLFFDPWPGEQYRVTRVSAAWVSDKMDRQGVGEGNRPIKEVSFLIEGAGGLRGPDHGGDRDRVRGAGARWRTCTRWISKRRRRRRRRWSDRTA
jgi:hypothetical protein